MGLVLVGGLVSIVSVAASAFANDWLERRRAARREISDARLALRATLQKSIPNGEDMRGWTELQHHLDLVEVTVESVGGKVGSELRESALAVWGGATYDEDVVPGGAWGVDVEVMNRLRSVIQDLDRHLAG